MGATGYMGERLVPRLLDAGVPATTSYIPSAADDLPGGDCTFANPSGRGHELDGATSANGNPAVTAARHPEH